MPEGIINPKNLGFVKAILDGSQPPVNTKMVWYDTTVNRHKIFSPTANAWIDAFAGQTTGQVSKGFTLSNPTQIINLDEFITNLQTVYSITVFRDLNNQLELIPNNLYQATLTLPPSPTLTITMDNSILDLDAIIRVIGN